MESRIQDCLGFSYIGRYTALSSNKGGNHNTKVLDMSQWISLIFRTNSELTDHWEVHFDDVTLSRIIGEGAFGKVYSGDFFKKSDGSRSRRISSRWGKKDTKDQKKPLRVAVKMLRSKIYDYKNVQPHTFKIRCRPVSQSPFPSSLA